MKRNLFLSLLGCICAGCLWAQTSTISGTWHRNTGGQLKVYQISDGHLLEKAVTQTRPNEPFSLSFTPSREDYYALGFGTNRYYLFYLKPGDPLRLDFTQESYVLTGKNNTAENKEMARWHEFVFPLESMTWRTSGKSYIYTDFFPVLEQKLAELKSYKPKKTKNKAFNATFADFRNIDLLNHAQTFIFMPHPKHPKPDEYPDYYRHIDIVGLTKHTALLHYPNGMHLLQYAYMLRNMVSKDMNEDEKKEKMQNPAYAMLHTDVGLIVNDTLKGELAVMFAPMNKTRVGLDNYKKNYGAYLVTDSQKKRFEKYAASFKNAPRTDATDFTFPDVNGMNHSLSDYKGKVVYVDVWATWCGPCKKELPFLKKLEAEYKDNPGIVFIGVSVDRGASKDKWKEFIAQQQLPGIQLFSGDDSGKIQRPYKITGIPRFMLVGKDGKMIYVDAPRPSSTEIRDVLNAALAE